MKGKPHYLCDKKIICILVLWLAVIVCDGTTIAYVVPPNTFGNESVSGPKGMDFDVIQPIVISKLGVFDSGSDGLNNTLYALIYNRDEFATPLARLVYTPSVPGELIGGSRFLDLDEPLYLPAGFHGSIVAEGYSGPSEPNGNGQGSATVPWTTDDGGGLISFVGTGRYGPTWNIGLDIFPTSIDRGPMPNRYAAGTFVMHAASDSDGDGIIDEIDNCLMVANANQSDLDADSLGDVCDICPSDPENDSDGDSVCGDVDECPNSDLTPTLILNGFDTGILNEVLDSGCSLADLIDDLLISGAGTMELVELLVELRAQGLISGKEMGEILKALNN